MRIRIRWLIGVALLVAIIVAGAWFADPALSAYVRSQVIEAIRKSGNFEVKQVQVSVFPSIHITIDGIAFHPPDRTPRRTPDRTNVPPLFTIDQAIVDTNWVAVRSKHVSEVRLRGLRIQVLPRKATSAGGGGLSTPEQARQSDFMVDRIIADGATLQIMPKDLRREPLEWDMKQLALHHIATSAALQFQTILENAKPPGEIHSAGAFGPWRFDDPALTPVSGTYTFRDANLGVFNGISGTLSSDGKYSGVLDRINVEGTTDTPDFASSVSGLPVHLKTTFQAVVDGSNGNTYLEPVDAQFGRSSFTVRGTVEAKPGVKGKTVSLDLKVNQGRLEDMLRLAVKSKQPPMTGAVSFHARMVIPPGDIDLARKLQLDGTFQVNQTQFSELSVQEKVDELSHRASGNPKASPDERVASNFQGRFQVNNGQARFANLTFTVPGADVALNGTYGLIDQNLDFHGTATMAAKISQMTTGIKSFLLKAVDPFFEKNHAGAVLPIKIEGTRDAPKFGLEFRRKK